MMRSATSAGRRARPPASCSLTEHFDAAYYSDCFTRHFYYSSDDPAIAIYRKMTHRTPAWVHRLLRWRDTLVKPLNMGATRGFNQKKESFSTQLSPGDPLDFFEVVRCEQDELLLVHNDPHFQVSLSINMERHAHTHVIYLSTLVTPRSATGKFYTRAISPVHRRIVNSMLNTLI